MATVPSPITWVTGVVVTASQLNTNIRDALNFFITPPLCVMRQVTGQSVGGGGYTAVTWDTEDIDRDGGHSTVSNTSRYTAQTAGWYDIQSTLVWPLSMTGNWVGTVLQINGLSASRYAKATAPVASGFNVATTTGTTLFLNVGDYVDTMAANGGSTATLATSDGASRTALRWVSS